MRVLIIGYSRIVQRKVAPALESLDAVDAVDIATRRGESALAESRPGKTGKVFENFDTALEQSQAELVYVSTVTAEHREWAEKALRQGFHVIVDKPATLTLREAEGLVELAEREGRCLAEALVYPFHPLIEESRALVDKEAGAPNHLVAGFSFPPLNADNFRYRKDAGGGAFLDLCRYAVSPGRIFFGAAPETMHGVRTGGRDGVETGFSMLMAYPGGRTCTGHFGFDTEYRNQLTILGEGISLELDRVFTPPPDAGLAIRVTRRDQARIVETRPSDCFANFISKLIGSINDGSSASWASILLEDARISEALGAAAGRS